LPYHLWPTPLHKIFLLYLTNGMIFKTKLLSITGQLRIFL
jgi:hypothetical protein